MSVRSAGGLSRSSAAQWSGRGVGGNYFFFVAFFLVAFFFVAFFFVAFFLVAFFLVTFFLVAFFLVAFLVAFLAVFLAGILDRSPLFAARLTARCALRYPQRAASGYKQTTRTTSVAPAGATIPVHCTSRCPTAGAHAKPRRRRREQHRNAVTRPPLGWALRSAPQLSMSRATCPRTVRFAIKTPLVIYEKILSIPAFKPNFFLTSSVARATAHRSSPSSPRQYQHSAKDRVLTVAAPR